MSVIGTYLGLTGPLGDSIGQQNCHKKMQNIARATSNIVQNLIELDLALFAIANPSWMVCPTNLLCFNFRYKKFAVKK
jgi:hypothetical protein